MSWSIISALIAVLTSVLLTFYLNRNLQRLIWRKDYERYEIDRIVLVFESIISKTEKREEIIDDIYDLLTIRMLLTRYVEEATKNRLNNIKKLCTNFNESLNKSKESTNGLSRQETLAKEDLYNHINEAMTDLREHFYKK